MSVSPLYSDILRLNEIGKGITRSLVPDADDRKRIARALDLLSLDRLDVEITIAPSMIGWRLSGVIQADAVQACGLTLEALPVVINERFSIDLVESLPETDGEEIEVSVDDEAPDLIENGRIDLGQYAVEQLSLALDPFPRKEGAEFVQPPEPVEISPFAVLNAFKKPDGEPST